MHVRLRWVSFPVHFRSFPWGKQISSVFRCVQLGGIYVDFIPSLLIIFVKVYFSWIVFFSIRERIIWYCWEVFNWAKYALNIFLLFSLYSLLLRLVESFLLFGKAWFLRVHGVSFNSAPISQKYGHGIATRKLVIWKCDTTFYFCLKQEFVLGFLLGYTFLYNKCAHVPHFGAVYSALP